MAVINRIAQYYDEMKEWRHRLHRQPELGLNCHKTAAFVVNKLQEFGVDEIHEKIGVTGVVALIKGGKPGPVIGLRADMDALPIPEARDIPHKSTVEGVMHACGHDGHTTMLLGAAKYLAETRNFSGSVALIFQPAEETIGGGRIMCQEGMMERFDIAQIYGIHNLPQSQVGYFSTCPGAILAAADDFEITITGAGGHAAMPNQTVDPVMIAVQIAQALQTIPSRNVDPIDTVVLSLTQIHTGTTHNVVPETAMMAGTVRTMDQVVQKQVVTRMQQIITQIAQAMGGQAELHYNYGYPATINDVEKTAFAADIAREISGDVMVDDNIRPSMGAEDFSYMLERRPGAYIYLGNGDSASLHHQDYDFNDETTPYGASYFVRLVEVAQPI